jgi:hypothetical protein
VKQERNILHTVKRGKGSWIGHILRGNCLLKRIIEGQKEETVRRRRRRKQLLDDLKEIDRGSTRCGELALEEAMDLL